MGRDTFHYPRLLQAPSNLTWDTIRDGAATASLGTLCQVLSTLTGKNFFLISNLNLMSFSLHLLFSHGLHSLQLFCFKDPPGSCKHSHLPDGNWAKLNYPKHCGSPPPEFTENIIMLFLNGSGNCDHPIPGSVQGQVGWGLEQPGIVEGVPAHGRGLE